MHGCNPQSESCQQSSESCIQSKPRLQNAQAAKAVCHHDVTTSCLKHCQRRNGFEPNSSFNNFTFNIFTKLHIHNLHHTPWPNFNANYSKVALTKLGRRAEQWNHSTNLFTQKAKVTFQFYLRTHIALTFNWNSCSGKSKKSSCVQLPLSISSCCNFPSICLSNTSDSSFKPFLTFDIPSYKLQQRNPSNFVLRSNQLNWKTHLIHPWPRNLLECVLFVSL